MKNKNTYIILIVILIIAAALRTYNITSIPLTHDEFSAVFRTEFPNFTELIEHGVKTDVHPAGIQVFLYYYANIFGTVEWIIKLPFILSGILTVFLIFLIGRKWYNDTVGLIAASFLASIQFAVIYSQIARPYISGLLFSLLMINFLTNIIQRPEKRLYQNLIYFVIAASLCMYNHYFSFLFAGIVGITGIFLVQKKIIIKYLIGGILIVLLYLPHLGVFLHQLDKGGVEAWLGKPQNDFFINYLHYIFQFSNLLIITAGILILFSFYQIKVAKAKTNFSIKFLIISILWFISPYIIGLAYSINVNSVLQFSVLIFSFPFLLFVLYAQFPEQNSINKSIIVLIILSTNIYSLIFERKHYDLFYSSPYEEIFLEHINKSSENVLSIIDTHQKIDPDQNTIIYKRDQCTHYNITQYYIDKLSIENDYVDYHSLRGEKNLVNLLEENHTNYDSLYFGCLSWSNPLIIPIIMDYFPKITWQRNYFAGTSYVFTKGENSAEIVSILDFESKNTENWSSIISENISDTLETQNNKVYFINSEWSPTYMDKLSNVIDHNSNNFVDISVSIFPITITDKIQLVSSIERSDGEVLDWRSTSFNTFIDTNENRERWFNIHHSIKMSDLFIQNNNDEVFLKVYIWNQGESLFFIDDFAIKHRHGNPLIYGRYNKIPMN
jgi:hypothetical protein